MRTVSILNHVLGPVMRGPSSSHTAGAFHIGCMGRSILGDTPRRAVLAFDPAGSYTVTREQLGLALLAAGAIGMILAIRGTFAAEVAGCQVEIGASGAMAAAAVVDAVGGTAHLACDAARDLFPEDHGERLRPFAWHG